MTGLKPNEHFANTIGNLYRNTRIQDVTRKRFFKNMSYGVIHIGIEEESPKVAHRDIIV